MQPSRALSRRAFAVAAAFEGSLVLIAWVCGTITDTPTVSLLRATASDLVLALAATVPMLLIIPVFARSSWAPFTRIRKLLDETMVPLFRHCTLDELIALALLAGLGEELLFRGWMQGWASRLTEPVGAIIVVSVAFGMAHAVTRTYAVLAGFISLYLGSLMLVTDSLLVPVIVHSIYDAVAFVVILRPGRTEPPVEQEPAGADEPPAAE